MDGRDCKAFDVTTPNPLLRFHVLAAILGLAVAGLTCVSVDGGAVEANWTIRTTDGRSIRSCGCTDPPITRVRLRVVHAPGTPQAGVDACANRADCEFSCGSEVGTTPFDLTPGQYVITLAPLGPGADAALKPAGAVPIAPILRNVVKGQVTGVGVFAIEAGCAATCGGSDPGTVCTGR